MFFKIVVLKNFANFTGKHLSRNCNFIKERLQHRCFPVNFAKFLRAPLFTEHLHWLIMTVSGFHTATLLKMRLQQRCFSVNFAKIFKNIFWQNTSGWVLLVFIGEFWEVFQNVSIIEHLWETAYFIYKLHNFNQQMQWKTSSQVLFKYFIQEREVAIRRCSFT